jgi:hypothetical protein
VTRAGLALEGLSNKVQWVYPFNPLFIEELRHLQVSLGAQTSYRKAADLLRMILPPMGGTTHTTIRSRVIAVGERIDKEIRLDIAENRKPDKPAKHMVISIDGAFVKGRPPMDRASLEIITGRVEADAEPSKVFAVVRDQDGRPNNTFGRYYGAGVKRRDE